MDLTDETFSFSWKAARILGVQSRPMSLVESLLVLPYSGDRDSFSEALHRARKGSKEFVTEFHVADAGESPMVSIRGKTFYNGGQPLILGVVSDITAASCESAIRSLMRGRNPTAPRESCLVTCVSGARPNALSKLDTQRQRCIFSAPHCSRC